MQKINRPFYLFWPDNSLITPVICQRVTCIYFKINKIKIAKNEKTGISGQNAGNGVFWNLSGRNNKKGVFMLNKSLACSFSELPNTKIILHSRSK